MSNIELHTPLPAPILRLVEQELEKIEGLPTTFTANAKGYMFSRDDDPFLIYVYDDFYFCGDTLVSVALTVIGDLRRASRGVLFFMSYIPFYILGAMRLLVSAKGNNKKSINAIEKYGFIHEGTFKKAADGVNDVVVYRLTAEESRWLTERNALEASKIKIRITNEQ